MTSDREGKVGWCGSRPASGPATGVRGPVTLGPGSDAAAGHGTACRMSTGSGPSLPRVATAPRPRSKVGRATVVGSQNPGSVAGRESLLHPVYRHRTVVPPRRFVLTGGWPKKGRPIAAIRRGTEGDL